MPAAVPLPFSVTIAEATRLTGLSKMVIYALLNEGKIEARERGTTTLVLMDDIQHYVEGLPTTTSGMEQKC